MITVEENLDAYIIYGNYSPITSNFFKLCASITYLDPARPGKIRNKFIASSLVRKSVWEKIGGFPDLRAAEDLIFMESAEKAGYKAVFSPNAYVFWQMPADLSSTFRRFALFSKYNVWAGRQQHWHYGVLKQYLGAAVFVVLGIIHSPWWFLMILLWFSIRVTKRIYGHRYEYGLKALNPFYFLAITGITLTIDIATFVGWGRAVIFKRKTDA